MSIDVEVALKRGAFALEASFRAGAGLTALFGRSGSGKTTVIDAIAGLVRPDHGRIRVGDQILFDSERRIDRPVHQRRIGYVFQEARLLPHLSVRQNLGYGRWFGRGGGAPGADLDGVCAMLGIAHLLERRPSGLSGGERQRVAIGRALLSRPRLLLMDEPLSALDEARKREILPYIERLRDETGVPIVYVSHSVAEVSRLASTVVVMENGGVTATGPAEVVLRRPELMPDAAEAGSVLSMSVVEQDEGRGLTQLSGPAGTLVVPRIDLPPGRPIRLRLPARDVIIAVREPVGLSARNRLAGHITAIAVSGGTAMAEIDCHGIPIVARLTQASVDELGLAPGLPVFAIVKSVAFDSGDAGSRVSPAIEI